jgi:formylmethanofuran dehydrogenase subunit C
VSGLRLTLRAPLSERINLGPAFATPWAEASAADVARREVWAPRSGPARLGDFFAVDGTPDGSVTLFGDLRLAERVGAGLAEGGMRVDGSVGDRAGAGLRGGRLEIAGNAGHSTGEGMSGGAIIVRGNTGNRAGAAAPGSKRGMTGGELVVFGSAGDEAGAAMRRGLVAIGGSTGRCALLSSIAGTVVACGPAGPDAALWNKRGSLVCLGSVDPAATYRYACVIQPVYLRLLLRRLRDVHGLPVTTAHIDGRFRRYSGDFAETGRGEILAWSSA